MPECRSEEATIIEDIKWRIGSGELWKNSKQRMRVQWLWMVHLTERQNPQLERKDIGPWILIALRV